MVEIPGYRIERELGRGGMATVYLAEQISLRRKVALKVLSDALGSEPGFVERFLREGRVAANLHHRHIVAIHDLGVHAGHSFMAMEYLPRGSIAAFAGDMAPTDVLRCVREIAGALDAAHRQGIVHRDVKPENILRHDDGAFLLTDFGIARVQNATAVLTREGTTAGTPAYMSPEQWSNQALDGRTDLYALGVVCYQLLTGQLPYHGSDGWAIGMQHLAAPIPRLPSEYRAVQPLLDRMLAKAPAERFADGAEVVRAIEALERGGTVPGRLTTPVASPVSRAWSPKAAAELFRTVPPDKRPRRNLSVALTTLVLALAVGGAAWWFRFGADSVVRPTATNAGNSAERTTIAVMPCTNWLAEPELAWLGDGLAEQIIHRLARLKGLSVIGRSSSFALRDAKLTGTEIGQRLGADLLLSCSLRNSRDGIRIATELTDTISNAQRWSAQFDRASEAIQDAVDEIAVGLAERLLANVVGTERAELLRHHTESLEALRLYLDAVLLAERWTQDAFVQAQAKVKRALELDPNFALAHHAEALLWLNRMQIENIAPVDALPQIEASLARALQFDPNLGEAYAMRCHAHWFRYEWSAAKSACSRAVLLSPNSGRVHMLVGQFETSFGSPTLGIEHQLRFRELEPENAFAWLNVAMAYTWAGQRERGLIEADATLQRFPDHIAGWMARGWTLIEMRRCEESIEAWNRAGELSQRNLEWVGWSGGAYACAGRRQEAEAIRAELLAAEVRGAYISKLVPLYVEAQLGNVEEALDLIEAAHASFDPSVTQGLALQSGILDGIRPNARFRALRAKYNFPPRE